MNKPETTSRSGALSRQSLRDAAVQAVSERQQALVGDPDATEPNWEDVGDEPVESLLGPEQSGSWNWLIGRPFWEPSKPKGTMPEQNLGRRLVDLFAEAPSESEVFSRYERVLREIREEFQRKVEELVRKTEPLVALLGDSGEATQSRELAWCAAHVQDLARVAPAFVAIDIEHDRIVIAEKAQAEFTRRLKELKPEELRRLYRVHTSMFV